MCCYAKYQTQSLAANAVYNKKFSKYGAFAVGFFQEAVIGPDKVRPHSKPKCACDTPHCYFALICYVVETTNTALFP